jgi:uncharacterized protein
MNWLLKKRVMIRLFISLLLCSALPVLRAQTPSKPFILGQIEALRSEILHENRILNIYLPPDYAADDTTRYPVLYLLDGSADEDFIHIVGLVQFNNFPWIKQMPPCIVVGIANVDRKRDFTYPSRQEYDQKHLPTSGGSAAFIAFLEKELQPFIEKKFRCNPQRTLIGQSLGGLVATEVLLKKPLLFDRYIIMSPSLWWDDGSLLQLPSPVYEKSFTRPTRVYIGVGKEGPVPCPTPHVMEVDANLLADRLKRSESAALKVYFDYLPAENHATMTHQAVFNAFRLIFP